MGVGWCSSVGGAIAVFFLLVALASLAAYLVKKYDDYVIIILGLISGFFFGSFVFTLIANLSGWEAEWGYWLITIIFAICGSLITYYFDREIIMIFTSILGSYVFMRAWTLFFPGVYPSESRIVSSSDEESFKVTAIFWLFVFLWIIFSSFCWIF